MTRMLVIVAVLLSKLSMGADYKPSSFWQRQIAHFILTSAMVAASYALENGTLGGEQTNSTEFLNGTVIPSNYNFSNYTNYTNSTNTTDIKATPFFTFASTWLGNAYGIVDALGWLIDWFTAWFFYFWGDRDAVIGLRAYVVSLYESDKADRHEQQIMFVANTLECMADLIETNKLYKDQDALLKMIQLAKNILTENLTKKDHEAADVYRGE